MKKILILQMDIIMKNYDSFLEIKNNSVIKKIDFDSKYKS